MNPYVDLLRKFQRAHARFAVDDQAASANLLSDEAVDHVFGLPHLWPDEALSLPAELWQAKYTFREATQLPGKRKKGSKPRYKYGPRIVKDDRTDRPLVADCPSNYAMYGEYEPLGYIELPHTDESRRRFHLFAPARFNALEDLALATLAGEAGAALPQAIRERLTKTFCPDSDATSLIWFALLWALAGDPMGAAANSCDVGQLPICHDEQRMRPLRPAAWRNPFLRSAEAIEHCRLHTEAPEFSKLRFEATGDGNFAMYFGSGQVRVSGKSDPVLITTPSCVKVLEYLVENRKATGPQLEELDGVTNASKTVRQICEADDKALDPYIKRPGRKRKDGGGYSTTIVDGRQN